MFVKSKGVLPPTGGSFGGLGVFAFSPETYIHTGAKHKRKLKMIVGDKKDEEKALADAENETIHLPVTWEEAVCMLKAIIFALQHMNMNNDTLALLPYIKGLRFLNNEKSLLQSRKQLASLNSSSLNSSPNLIPSVNSFLKGLRNYFNK